MTELTLAGGCFWCLDAVFRNLKGVTSSQCGYTGGSAKSAEYFQVASGKTNHVEAVRVTFDESILPVDDLLDIYFLIHNPTTFDRQGGDVGPQYRSVMFYKNDTQKALFKKALKRASQHYDDPIVTKIDPSQPFYEAEPEHQDFYANNPAQPYCAVVISPKVQKARAHYAQYMTT